MATTIKTTPLNAWHRRQGANMADFGGYDMPLWYSSVKEEHLAVLTGAGVFDTSHMASLRIGGGEATELLQKCFSRDLRSCFSGKPLTPGRCVYGVFLEESGNVIDDAIVYMLAENDFMVVVNAGMGGIIVEHLAENGRGLDIKIINFTDAIGKLDLQGPASAKILSGLLESPELVFDGFLYFSFKGSFHQDGRKLPGSPVRLRTGEEVLISRSGYTGEFGFEIFTSGSHFVELWNQIVDAGQPSSLLPCGLASRDSLRAGAVLPLSHQDIGPWPYVNHPWEFALPYLPDKSGFTKSFIGDRALLEAVDAPFTYAFVVNDLRKVGAGSGTRIMDGDGKDIGHVLTCATDVGIGRHEDRIFSIASPDRPADFRPKGLSCGFILANRALQPGDAVKLADSRRNIDVTIATDIRPDRTARRPMKEFI